MSDSNDKVQCLSCKAQGTSAHFHRLDVHLSTKHKISVAEYRAQYPGAPTISASAAARVVAAPRSGVAQVKGNVVGDAPTDEGNRPAKGGRKPFIFKSGVELFQRADLTEADRIHIPTFDEDWEMGPTEIDKWEAMAVAIQSGENILDVGPTGCGKTAGIHQLAAALDQPVRRFQLSGESRVADFVGTKVVEVDEDSGEAVTRFQNGILVDAMEKGHWLILDELDGAPPAILFTLHSVLEAHGKLVLTADGGRVVKRHKDFRVFATANTLGRGDDTGLYTGTNVLNEAFLDRFGVVLQSTYPAKESEIRILVNKTGVEEVLARRMVDVATRVREALANEECYCTFSTRRLLTWAGKAVALRNTALAARVTVLNKLGKDDAKFVGDIIQRIIG